MTARTMLRGRAHVRSLADALARVDAELDVLESWGERLATVLSGGGRLLAVGNGGSAAEAQHLTAEFVGRYCHDRPAYAAIALHAETSTVTAVLNDYGADEVFARSVRAHGRPGDVLVALSTSGTSPNVLAAVAAARQGGLTTWALTGRGPNPLAETADEAICYDAPPANVQELHLVSIHVICAAFDAAVGAA